MKKEHLIWPIVIIIITLIFSLSFYFVQINKQKINKINNNQQVAAQQNSNNQKTQEDYFQKKVECEKYKDQITQSINQYNAKQKPEVRNSNNQDDVPIYNLYVENNELKELFYSPKVNSCVYLESRRTLVKRGANADPNTGDWGISNETYYLIDVLTSKEIDFNKGLSFLQIKNRSEPFMSEKEADLIINEYR